MFTKNLFIRYGSLYNTPMKKFRKLSVPAVLALLLILTPVASVSAADFRSAGPQIIARITEDATPDIQSSDAGSDQVGRLRPKSRRILLLL